MAVCVWVCMCIYKKRCIVVFLTKVKKMPAPITPYNKGSYWTILLLWMTSLAAFIPFLRNGLILFVFNDKGFYDYTQPDVDVFCMRITSARDATKMPHGIIFLCYALLPRRDSHFIPTFHWACLPQSTARYASAYPWATHWLLSMDQGPAHVFRVWKQPCLFASCHVLTIPKCRLLWDQDMSEL